MPAPAPPRANASSTPWAPRASTGAESPATAVTRTVAQRPDRFVAEYRPAPEPVRRYARWSRPAASTARVGELSVRPVPVTRTGADQRPVRYVSWYSPAPGRA